MATRQARWPISRQRWRLIAGQPYARGELLHLKMYGADWEDFEAEKALIDEGVRNGQRVVRPFVYQALSSSPADLQACSRIFAANLFPPFDQPPAVPPQP